MGKKYAQTAYALQSAIFADPTKATPWKGACVVIYRDPDDFENTFILRSTTRTARLSPGDAIKSTATLALLRVKYRKVRPGDFQTALLARAAPSSTPSSAGSSPRKGGASSAPSAAVEVAESS